MKNNNISDSAGQHSDLVRQNRKLTSQIKRLQEQLGRIDLNLHIQEGVLEKIDRISQLSRKINCLDLEKIASVCIEEIPRLISARFASLYRFDSDQGVMHLLRHNHPYAIDRLVVLDEHENSPMAIAVKQKKLLVLKDISQNKDSQDTTVKLMFARNYKSNSCIIAPLMSGESVLGVLNLADKIDGPYFDATGDSPPVELLCEIVGSAMSNIKLYDEVREQARTDSMTGLVNHRTFYDELDKEVARSKRYGGSLSLIMVDLDNLKKINDKKGHRSGDAVLLHVAEQIVKCTRANDVAARYGGDEFAIILPNTSVAEAMVVAERLANLVADQAVLLGGDKLFASVSIGVGQYRTGYSIEEFMNESDEALFRAKSMGKNRINVFEPAVK